MGNLAWTAAVSPQDECVRTHHEVVQAHLEARGGGLQEGQEGGRGGCRRGRKGDGGQWLQHCLA